MKNFISLLLLFPVIGLTQELPDEDWVCISDGYSLSTSKNGEIENTTYETNLSTIIFNPTKGRRDIYSYDWGLNSCALENIIYRCRSELRPQIVYEITQTPDDYWFWQLNSINGKFIYGNMSLKDEASVMVFFGHCSKV